MRDPKRIDRMIELLRQRWHQEPDQRLGQLVFNVVREHGEQIHHPEVATCFVPLIDDGRMEQHLRDGLRPMTLNTNSFTTTTTNWKEVNQP